MTYLLIAVAVVALVAALASSVRDSLRAVERGKRRAYRRVTAADLVKATQAANDFDRSMRRVQEVMAVSADEIERFRKATLGLAESNSPPT
jgi:hypothetical protein